MFFDYFSIYTNYFTDSDLFIHMMKLKNTLRKLMNESPITHLDTNGVEHRIEELECYD